VNWNSYTIANGLADNLVYSIAIDNKDNKWFGTNKGVSKFDNVNWNTYTIADGLADKGVAPAFSTKSTLRYKISFKSI